MAARSTLTTNKVSSEGGLKEKYAKEMDKQPNLLDALTLSDEGGVETSASTGVDKQTVAHIAQLDGVRAQP